MTLEPSGMWTIAAYRDEDAEDVALLMNEIPELPTTSAASFRAFTALSFNRGARDFRVVRTQSHLIGLLTSTLLESAEPTLRHFRIAVHPDHQRRRLGTMLLTELQQQEAPPGVVFQCNSQGSWGGGNAFLERAGFRVSRTELLMRRMLPGPVVDVPVGFRVRTSTADDDNAWIALHAEAYGGSGDFSALTHSDVQAERNAPGFSLVLAERDNQVVGYCHGMQLEANEALINSLVVRPCARGRGLGAALLSASLHSFSSQFATASLNVVSSNLAAISVYHRMGFEVYDRMLTFQLPSELETRTPAPISTHPSQE